LWTVQRWTGTPSHTAAKVRRTLAPASASSSPRRRPGTRHDHVGSATSAFWAEISHQTGLLAKRTDNCDTFHRASTAHAFRIGCRWHCVHADSIGERTTYVLSNIGHRRPPRFKWKRPTSKDVSPIARGRSGRALSLRGSQRAPTRVGDPHPGQLDRLPAGEDSLGRRRRQVFAHQARHQTEVEAVRHQERIGRAVRHLFGQASPSSHRPQPAHRSDRFSREKDRAMF
jgi:hypothetical protein